MPIKSEEIADLSGFIAELEKALQLSNKITEKLTKDLKQGTSTLKMVDPKDAESIKKIDEQINKLKIDTEQLNTANAQKISIEQEINSLTKKRTKLQAQLSQGNTKLSKDVAVLNEKRKQQNKLIREEAKETAGLLSPYDKLSKKLTELRRRYKDLAVQEKENTKEARALLNEITKLDTKIKKVDTATGQFIRNVGNYSSAMGGAIKQTKGFLLTLAGGYGVVSVLRSGFNVVKEFDQAMGNLSAVTGKTREELTSLKNQARELGATTEYTAGQVASLQTELARLGFSTSEIEQSTDSILDFATATGAQLPDAAALAGSALRAFNLDASEMGRVVSVLGVATSKSALDFEKLNNSLSTVAPVANAFGFSIEDTTALLGKLADAGFDASSAGTATRNILLNLADSNGKLAKSLGRPVNNLDDLVKGMDELSEKGIDLAEALELTDKRSVAAFETFLKQSDGLITLRDNITGAEKGLKTMAETQRDTLGGAIKELQSAWEGLVLDLSEGAGEFISLKDIIKFVARNLKDIVKVVVVATSAWASFKIALKIQNLLINASNGIKSMGKGMMFLTGAFKKGSFSVKRFGAALKSIPFVGIISGITTIITSIGLFSSKTDQAKLSQELFNKALEVGIRRAEQYNKRIDESLGSLSKQTQQRLDLARAAGASEEEINKIRLEGINELDKAIIKERNQLSTRIEQLADAREEYIAYEKEYYRKLNDIEKLSSMPDQIEQRKELNKQHGDYMFNKAKELGILNEKDGLNGRLISSSTLLGKIEGELDTIGAKTNELLEKRNDLEHDKKVVVTENNRIEKESVSTSNKKTEAKAKEIKQEKKYIQVKKEASEIIKEIDNDRKEAEEKDMQEVIDAVEKSHKKKVLEIEKSYKTEEELRDKNIEEEIKYLEHLIDIYKAYGKDTIELELELQQKRNEKRNIANDEVIKKEEEAFNERVSRLQEIDGILNKFNERQLKRDQERINSIDTEIQKLRERQNTFQQLAAQGNLDADKSLAAEIKREEKLEKERRRIEQKAQRRELFLSAFKTYQSKVEAGDKSPIVSTLRDLAILAAGVSGFKTFYEGTEGSKTVGEMLGTPHLNTAKDGYVVRVDKNERIFNPRQTKAISGYTNDQIADIISNRSFESMNISKMYSYSPVNNKDVFSMEQTNRKLDELISKPTYLGGDFDNKSKAWIELIMHKGRIEKKITKLNDIDW